MSRTESELILRHENIPELHIAIRTESVDHFVDVCTPASNKTDNWTFASMGDYNVYTLIIKIWFISLKWNFLPQLSTTYMDQTILVNKKKCASLFGGLSKIWYIMYTILTCIILKLVQFSFKWWVKHYSHFSIRFITTR